MDFRVRIAFLFGTGSIFFLVGYLYGEMQSTTPSSNELQSMMLNLQEMVKPSRMDLFLKGTDLDQLEKMIMSSESWASAEALTSETITERLEGLQGLRKVCQKVLEDARLGLADARYERARTVLTATGDSLAVAMSRLDTLLSASMGAQGRNWSAAGPAGEGVISVRVAEKPFGAHIKRGTLEVIEVFPGFPAHRNGVQPGCELLEVAGQLVTAGTWMEVFQQAATPFDIRLRCGHQANSTAGRGPLVPDPHRYRVMVTKKPFGMNIQVHVAPRVVEVLPGFPAEAAGVREGFVLKEINEQPVDAVTWFKAFQNTPLPFTLTFDTLVPVHAGNPFLAKGEAPGHAKKELPPLRDSDYADFKCEVLALPFGMQIRAPLDGWPVAYKLVEGLPAEKQGVREGDVLVEVAGRPVNSSTWFAAFQQSAPPFGLRFRRPKK